ncbi:unnamed protein product [Lupinus luteus]|uniref:Protein PAF1 homolog n=1 Tax=Lupinus luteus TaxID=3873 RepID=A0AAV1WIQ8_LUPLU
MSSYRPFPPPPPQPPPSSAAPPPPPPPQNWGGGAYDPNTPSFPQSYNNQIPPNSNFHNHHASGYAVPPFPPSNHNHFPYPPPQQPPPPPPPPPPETSYPPPPPPPPPSSNAPPPPPVYYSSQYYQPPPPPPPPASPPPASPPPPPKNQNSEVRDRDRGLVKDVSAFGRRENEHSNHGASYKKQKVAAAAAAAVPPMPMKKANGPPPGRVETEEERRLRKKREFEKQRQEEKHRQKLKESQNTVLQKTHMLGKGNGSVIGSRMGERKATPLLSGDRIENRLKKPTTFLCKMKFRNELPDPSAQPKLMAFKKDKDQYTEYRITSLEKMYKPKLFVEPDLGIPLDLLDLSVYNPPSVRRPLDPEDEELLRDDEAVVPIKKDGIKRKDRPTDKGVAWLVKTQYISPLSMESAKQSLTEKQTKDLREKKGGRNVLENLNNRERQIREIDATFEAAKSLPVHATKKDLYPVEVMPLLPDFDRYDGQFVVAAFDNAPTVDSELYTKLNKSVRDTYESRAVMKSFVTGSDPANPEKFLAYMAPTLGELSKDIYDENEDVLYSWVREYHWDVRGEDADDPTTFLVSFDESEARYLPLPTKLVLRKKRAKEGRSGDDIEQFPVPSRLTVRWRSSASVIEQKDSWAYSSSKGSSSKKRGLEMDDGLEQHRRVGSRQDNYESSGTEDDMSE